MSTELESFPFEGVPFGSSEFRTYFQMFFSSGVVKGYLNALQVSAAGTNMQTTVATGGAIVNGYCMNNPVVQTLVHDTASASYDRIDRVVICVDTTLPKVYPKIKKGTASASPALPSLQQDSIIYEIPIAQVRIVKGRSYIDNTQITDERSYADAVAMSEQIYLLASSTPAANASPNILTAIPMNVKEEGNMPNTTYDVQISQAGLYRVDAYALLSGLNEDKVAELIVRRKRVDGTYNDFTGYKMRGTSSWSENFSNIPLLAPITLQVEAGSVIQFFFRHDDVGPRAIDYFRVTVAKV